MMSRFPIACAFALVLAGCDAAAKKSADPAPEVAIILPEQVSFNEHIRPILAENCYDCHGPDSKTRRPKDAPLRLDRAEDAFGLRDDGRPVIIKGKPAESKLMKLVRSADPDMIMPPHKSRKTLKRGEIAILERWIEQGAEYQADGVLAPVE